MATLRTEITEIVTGLGTLGEPAPEPVLAAPEPPAELVGVLPEHWDRLRAAWAERTHEGEFHAAFNNGRAFLGATDGLRGRHPVTVEWKGGHRDPAGDAVPADLRIDHVYLVSCKYASKVLHNASPWSLFDRCLAGAPARGAGDWYEEVAPAEHQAHYQAVRRIVDSGDRFPERVRDLDRDQRRALATARDRTSPESAAAYAELATAVSQRSALRWSERLNTQSERRSMLWRLLRLSATPYFMLGTGRSESLRLRVATPWDWNQQWDLAEFAVAAESAGQPRIRWRAVVEPRLDSAKEPRGLKPPTDPLGVAGHVEIRWSHGRLGGSPEAKVYLDTPHRDVPGYFELV